MPEIDVEGAAVAFDERGKGQALVLIHGWNSTRKQWLLNLKAFAPRFRVIAPDLPGYGESAENKAFPWSRDGMSDFLDAFRGALHLPSFHLIGHSMGGCIAVRYTVRHPERVGKLVLVSTPTRTVSMGLHALLPGAECTVSRLYRFRSETAIKWLFYRALYKPEQQDLDFVRTNVRAGTRTSRRALAQSIRVVRNMDLADDLASIDAPVLIVFGDRDKSVNARESQRQRSLLPHPYVGIISSCGHCPPYEKPEIFNKLAMEFLESGQL